MSTDAGGLESDLRATFAPSVEPSRLAGAVARCDHERRRVSRVATPANSAMRILTDSSRDLESLRQVPLGVHLRHVGFGVTENHLRRLKSELATDLRRRRVP